MTKYYAQIRHNKMGQNPHQGSERKINFHMNYPHKIVVNATVIKLPGNCY